MPFNSAMALFKTHQPLRLHLQTQLGRPIELYTSSGYPSHVEDVLSCKFDILITGPHFGVMSMEKGYQPLVQYKTRLKPLFVVRKDSGITDVEGLKDKKIGLSSRLSISSIGGIKWLVDHGLTVDRDVTLIEEVSHGAAIAAVAVGTLDAAITTYTPLNQIPKDVMEKVSVLPTEIETSHLMTLAHSRLGAEETEKIRSALELFPETQEGKDFFTATGYLGYEPVAKEDIINLQSYIDITRDMLGKKQ